MEKALSETVRKWIKKCLKEEFEERARKGLEGEKNAHVVAGEIISFSDMEQFIGSIKNSLVEERGGSSSSGRISRLFGSRVTSFESDTSDDDWGPLKSSEDRYTSLIDIISQDKPVHVRLAGYERLLESELGNIGNSESWDALLKTLGEGIADESRPVFEASLQVHARLLDSSRSHDVYTNLLTVFETLNKTRKLNETFPTFTTGINFKYFLHEKILRLMRLIVHHQEEIVKNARTVDKVIEDVFDQFIVFLSSHTVRNSMQAKRLSTLNILSVLEPQADWSKRWIHGLATRKTVITALGKSPSLLETLLLIVGKGLDKAPNLLAFTVTDEPPEVFISGETVETVTYLHALNFLAQLISYSAGRALLSESPFQSALSFNELASSLVSSLNIVASSSTTTNGVYDVSRQALQYMFEKSPTFSDGKFYHVALNPLMRNSNGEAKIYPHNLDSLNHMLECKEGVNFLTGDHRTRSANPEKPPPRYPIVAIFEYTAKLLKQPFSVMNIDHVVDLFRFIGRAFGVHELHGVLENTLKEHFFPAVAYLYSKMNKYAVRHESKTQYLDSAAKSMLLKVVASPLGLRTLVNESSVFEELIRGSIAPLRAPWSSSDIVSFVSSAAYFDLGSKTINDLAPQSLSTALEEISTVFEDPYNFYDPWENWDIEKFVHVLYCLSLSTRCFIAFMSDSGIDANDEYDYPRSMRDLIKHSINMDSQYHYLGLLTIDAFTWNIDINIFLSNFCNFQEKMLGLQKLSVYESEEDGLTRTENIIDSCSLLRHRILTNCYYVRHKLEQPSEEMEEIVLFSEFPPSYEPRVPPDLSRSDSSSELSVLLENSKPGLRDSGWILEVRKAYKNSSDRFRNSDLIDLLDQMQKAIPTADWVDNFKWNEESKSKKREWTKEENMCFELAIHYAEINCSFEKGQNTVDDIKTFFQAAHKFINFTQPKNFEGFDWFLATIFIICDGKLDVCKKFVEQIIRFPSAMFMWPIFGLVIDRSNDEEMVTQCILGQHIEDLIDKELSTVNWALKNECGVHWWMICNRLMSQCFWGLLPWNEIINFIAISILHSADYVAYYCVSLLHHCQTRLMEDVANKKMWPDHMFFGDYRCHNHMAFIDRIGKRYRNRVLPSMTQRKLITEE